MKNQFAGAKSLEKETEDNFTAIDEPLIQKTSHNIQDIGERIISDEKWILYIKKQKFMQAEVQFLRNFCNAFNIELTIKHVSCDSFSNISVPCIKIRNYLIEKKDFSDLIYQGFCQQKNIQDINTKKYFEYLISLMEKIQMALEYEMWYDQSTDYSYRNRFFSIAQPLETLQNLYNYKLEKNIYQQLGINNQADMIDKVKALLIDLEASIANIKYFKYHDQSASFCDILVYSYLQTIFNNIPQSQLVKEIDQLPKLTKFYAIFSDIKKTYPIETLNQQLQPPSAQAGDQAGTPSDKAQSFGGIAPKTQKQKIISYCVVGAFTALYLLVKQ